MIDIPDDPIIRSMEDTGYPPWMQDGDDDTYNSEPFAVYDPYDY